MIETSADRCKSFYRALKCHLWDFSTKGFSGLKLSEWTRRDKIATIEKIKLHTCNSQRLW